MLISVMQELYGQILSEPSIAEPREVPELGHSLEFTLFALFIHTVSKTKVSAVPVIVFPRDSAEGMKS